jgi:RNA ligase (TIGR02306 family)
MSRKLARVAQITAIKPIAGADKIECVVVENGWEVVVKKGEYAPGSIAIYLEVDSWVPHELAPFLTPKGHEPREYNGVKGERLRTVRLRGQISSGLLLKLESCFKVIETDGKKFIDIRQLNFEDKC